jgi:hypothetical protein
MKRHPELGGLLPAVSHVFIADFDDATEFPKRVGRVAESIEP